MQRLYDSLWGVWCALLEVLLSIYLLLPHRVATNRIDIFEDIANQSPEQERGTELSPENTVHELHTTIAELNTALDELDMKIDRFNEELEQLLETNREFNVELEEFNKAGMSMKK